MNSALIIAGVQATLRAAQAGAELLSEHARDKPVFLPNIEYPEDSHVTELLHFFEENPQLATSRTEYSVLWDEQNQQLIDQPPAIINTAVGLMLQHKAKIQLQNEGIEDHEADREATMLAGGRMVEQWRRDRKPPSVYARMALTLVDIGLEFVSANPSILGVGSRGEKLVVAFATHVETLIPDAVVEFGEKEGFTDRLVGIFLRAGMATLANNSSLIVRDEDVAKLISGVTKPIVEALPDNLIDQVNYRSLVDTLAGPSAAVAFELLAENTESYLGKDFADDKALGAVTSALFASIKETTANGTIVNVFSKDGFVSVYKAGLGVAIDRPELFIKDDQSNPEFFRALLKGAFEVLVEYPRFQGPVGASLAVMTIETVGEHAPTLFRLDSDVPLEDAALDILQQLTTGLSEALVEGDGEGVFRPGIRLFKDTQLLEFGRVVLSHALQTPGMAGGEKMEIYNIISGLSKAIKTDGNSLLTPDQWITIADMGAHTASANPGRLFRLTDDDSTEVLGEKILTSIIAIAGENWKKTGRGQGTLLFGETLETVIGMVFDALSGDITAVLKDHDLVANLLASLLKLAESEPGKIGSSTMLELFEQQIVPVLALGKVPTEAELIEALK